MVFIQGKRKRKLNNKYLIVISCIVLTATFFLIKKNMAFYSNLSRIHSKLEEEEIKNSKLNEIYNQKNRELENIKTNAGKEEYLREVYPVGRTGEKVILLFNPTTTEEEIATSTNPISEFQKFKDKIKFFIDNYTNL
jgi:hypothetical protein